MTKFEDYKLIEKYIDNTLRAEELEIFTNKYKKDLAFQKEVNLHVKLQAQLSDKRKMDLISTLSTLSAIYSEKKTANKFLTVKYISIAAASAIILISVWFFGFKNANKPTENQKQHVEIENPTFPSDEIIPEKEIAEEKNETPHPTESKTLVKVEKPNTNDSNYASNDYFESLMERTKSNAFKFEIVDRKLHNIPANSQVSIEGTLETKEDISNHSVVMKLYKNSAISELHENSIQVDKLFLEESEEPEIQGFVNIKTYNFEIETGADLADGLYYYTIVDETKGHILFVGKTKID
jgi:hypothetical protein